MTRAVALAATLFFVLTLAAGCEPGTETTAESPQPGRIVTLAPHLAELVFAAGSGDLLVGVSAYSDFPPQAAEIEIVSDAFTVDQERLKLLDPDLVLAWQSGTPAHVIDELRTAGYRVEAIRTRGLDDIAAAIRRIGELTGSSDAAESVAANFESDLQSLGDAFAGNDEISVFYQVSLKPLYTINGEHYIGELIELCGGDNVFAGLGELAPAVSVEAVVDRNPEVIVAGSADGDAAFVEWRRWPHVAANRYGNYFSVNSDEVTRPSLRLVAAAGALCRHLETARANRRAAAN